VGENHLSCDVRSRRQTTDDSVEICQRLRTKRTLDPLLYLPPTEQAVITVPSYGVDGPDAVCFRRSGTRSPRVARAHRHGSIVADSHPRTLAPSHPRTP
jgi:hypothetical protein